MSRPEPPVIDGYLTRTGSQIVIQCPYCPERHFHGAVRPGEIGAGDGHRYPQSAPGYIIKTVGYAA